MKYLIYLLIIFIGCSEVTFDVVPANKYLENVNVVIKDDKYVLENGELPLTITARKRDDLIAIYEVHVSNWGHNHCGCELIDTDYWKCKEPFEVDGSDWEVGK